MLTRIDFCEKWDDEVRELRSSLELKETELRDADAEFKKTQTNEADPVVGAAGQAPEHTGQEHDLREALRQGRKSRNRQHRLQISDQLMK